MRPLKLKLQGLRSYREEQEVDFEGASLVAIVGDTGAGKSSLLEALTVALYGTSTWDGKETKQLISDGAAMLQVSLTFRADDRVWRVERAIPRGTYPPARHTLELDGGGERLDRKDAVDARVRQLVGLDYDAFLRSVVLPQGRFAALLTAKQAERASILKGILRIDRLDVVREEAREARDRMMPVVAGLQERRARLLPDPAAAEREATERLAAAESQRDAAREARAKVAAARDASRAAQERRRTLESTLARAAEGRVADAESTLRSLAERDAEIAALLAENDTAMAQKRAEEEDLVATIDEAEKKGAGPVSLANAKSALSLLAEELPLLTADAASIDKDEALFAKESADLEKVGGMLASFEEAESAAKAAVADRQSDAKKAQTTLEQARRLLADLRKAEQEEAKAKARSEKARADLDKATLDLEAAESDAKKAKAKLTEAESESRAAAQKHAAHHAAEGAKPGDPCPVCERPLPDGFEPPRAPAVEAAQKKLEDARKKHDAAREKATGARAKAESERGKLTDAESDLAERASHTAAATGALTAVLPGASGAAGAPGAGDATAAPAVTADDAALLAAATRAQQSAAKALAEAEAHLQHAREILLKARATLDSERKRLADRKATLTKSRDALAARRKRYDDTLRKIPEDLRPREPNSAPEITAQLARVEVRKLKIERLVKERDEAHAGRRALEMLRAQLDDRRRREVESRRGDLDVRLATFRERLSLLAEALPADMPSPRPEAGPLTDLADWAADFDRAAASLLAAAEAAVTAARDAAHRSDETAQLALTEAGVDSEPALDAALARAEATRESALADQSRARAEIPLARALDERIDRSQSLAASLSEVIRLVADGKLIHHVVHRRQRVLLAVASELLGSMTRARYGFSEDFDVVDRLSGQARGTRTLSGGETFLASLALSLALVELAGRAGGRLEALFLDEGFGSLDAGSLSVALDALTRKAEGGRLVAVISHLRSVAESIDRVLSVRSSPTGSHVKWITSEERERMLAEDVERGLIS